MHSGGRAHHVYILNKPLARDLNSRNPSQRGGLIFILDTDCESTMNSLEQSLKIYLPSNLQGKL